MQLKELHSAIEKLKAETKRWFNGIVKFWETYKKEVNIMTQYHIYLCCGGGLSSGFLAQKARAAAKKAKLNATIEAKSESEVVQYLPKMDILCIGPHYEFRLKAFQEMAAPYGVPVIVIPEEIYSMLDGAALLDLALGEMKKS